MRVKHILPALLGGGVDPKVCDKDGRTALHLLCAVPLHVRIHQFLFGCVRSFAFARAFLHLALPTFPTQPRFVLPTVRTQPRLFHLNLRTQPRLSHLTSRTQLRLVHFPFSH